MAQVSNISPYDPRFYKVRGVILGAEVRRGTYSTDVSGAAGGLRAVLLCRCAARETVGGVPMTTPAVTC